MVGNSLEVRKHAEIFIGLGRLLIVHMRGRQTEQIVTQLILVTVHDTFQIKDFLQSIFTEFTSYRNRTLDAFLCLLRHGLDNHTALVQCQCRVGQESGLEAVHILLLGNGIRAVREDGADDLFQDPDHRRQKDHDAQTVQRIGQGDMYHAHLHRHEAEADKCI